MNLLLDSDTLRLVRELGELRAHIANYQVAGLVNKYPELDGIAGEGAAPGSELVIIRAAVQRELARHIKQARDMGIELPQ